MTGPSRPRHRGRTDTERTRPRISRGGGGSLPTSPSHRPSRCPMDHRHTERVPGFPACRLFALLDSDAAVEGALVALTPHVEPGAVQVLTGERGVRALDVSGGAHGLRRRVLRAIQDLAFGRSSLGEHESHLRRGGAPPTGPGARVGAVPAVGEGPHPLRHPRAGLVRPVQRRRRHAPPPRRPRLRLTPAPATGRRERLWGGPTGPPHSRPETHPPRHRSPVSIDRPAVPPVAFDARLAREFGEMAWAWLVYPWGSTAVATAPWCA
jgi:hypothetical protein